MPNLPINHVDRATQTNRKYWKLQYFLKEILPRDDEPFLPLLSIPHLFSTKRDFWDYSCGFVDMAYFKKYHRLRASKWLEIELTDHMRDTDVLDLRVGIVRKSGKEVVASNAEIISPEITAVIRVIRHSELRKIMQSYNDLEFFVIVDGKNKEIKKDEKNKFYMQKFRMDYKELFLSGRNSDFTINVKPMKFEVHSSILGARSPVFSAMMEHEMKEKRNAEVSIIDTDPAVFQEFLLYLYTGDEEHLNWENVIELYKLGDKYCVEDLQYLCVERMKLYISIENFFGVFYISQQLGNSELSEVVINFFLEDFNEIIKSEMCTEFIKEHPGETYVLMKALLV